jgi:hypothetical protein
MLRAVSKLLWNSMSKLDKTGIAHPSKGLRLSDKALPSLEAILKSFA